MREIILMVLNTAYLTIAHKLDAVCVILTQLAWKCYMLFLCLFLSMFSTIPHVLDRPFLFFIPREKAKAMGSRPGPLPESHRRPGCNGRRRGHIPLPNHRPPDPRGHLVSGRWGTMSLPGRQNDLRRKDNIHDHCCRVSGRQWAVHVSDLQRSWRTLDVQCPSESQEDTFTEDGCQAARVHWGVPR